MLFVVHGIDGVPQDFDASAFEIDDNGTLVITDGNQASQKVLAAFASGAWGAVVPKG